MNCSKARKWLLLDDAGELPGDRRARLDAHLRRCAECRTFAASLQDLRGQYSADSAAPATPAPTLSAILAAARDFAPARRRAEPVRRLWWTPPRALAAVAALFLFFSALAAGLWRQRMTGAAATLTDATIREAVSTAVAAIESEWSAIESDLAMVRIEIGDWLDAANEPTAERPGAYGEKGAGT